MVDSDAVVRARRVLGAQLAALRGAAGHTQHGFAPSTGYSRSTLANAETGRQHVQRDFWERCDAALGTGGALTLGFEQIKAADRQQREHEARQARAEVEARMRTVRSEFARTVKAPSQVSSSLSSWPADLDLLTQEAATFWVADTSDPAFAGVDLGAAALRWLIASADPPAVRTEAWPRITLGDVRRLQGVQQRMKDLDNALGGGTALPLAVAYLRCEVASMLRGRYDETTGRALMTAVAELTLDVGWMAYDVHQHHLARRHLTHALRFAHAGGQRLLGARILSALCHQALHVGQLPRALDLIEAARNGPPQPVPPRAAAMLAAMAACVWAAAGDATQCGRALDEGESALSRVSPDDQEPA